MDLFNFVWGSVTGGNHYKSRKNGQDTYSIYSQPNFFVGFVADGCGDPIDSPFSEVGSRIGARMAVRIVSHKANQLLSHHPWHIANPRFWSSVQSEMLVNISKIAHSMGENLSEVISRHFLFTLIGAVITPEVAVFVTLGDGLVFINGQYLRIGPYQDNMPVYLAYNLIKTHLAIQDPEALQFKVQRVIRTADLNSFLFGSDGLEDLLNAAGNPLPGRDDLVGPMSQFWTDEVYFHNPHAATNRLRLIAEEKRFVDWENQSLQIFPGHLPDDTTFVAGARKT